MGPLLVMAASVAMAGGVHVEDARGCLDPEAIDLEVRSTLGDRPVDELDLFARLDDRQASWLLRLEVVDREGAVLWKKSIEVQEVDCPYLPALVARSVEQGLADVPGWELSLHPRRLEHEVSFRISATAPTSLHVGGGGGAAFGVGGPVRWVIDTEVFGSGVQGVGDGGGQLLGWMFGSGLAVDRSLGSAGAVRFRSTLAGGPVLAFGRDFTETYRRLIPRMTTLAEASWVSTGVLQVGIRMEVPLVRIALVDSGTGDRAVEPPVRVGLVLALGTALRSSEAAGSGRP